MRIVEALRAAGLLENLTFTILDIGARDANVEHWAVLGERLRYYGFEPDEASCLHLNQQSAAKHLPWQEKYFPMALGRANEERVFYITNAPACSSLLEPNAEALEGFLVKDYLFIDKITTVRTSTLSNWAGEYQIGAVDFIKIDVQGAELEILQSGDEVLQDCLGLQTEVEFIPLYKQQPLFPEVDCFVRERGFLLFDLQRVYNKRTSVPKELRSRGQLTWGDALYLRDISSLRRTDPQTFLRQLMKLAVIADLYDRPDYAVFVLETALNQYPELLTEFQGKLHKLLADLHLKLQARRSWQQGLLDLSDRLFSSRLGRFLNRRFPQTFAPWRRRVNTRQRGYFWRA